LLRCLNGLAPLSSGRVMAEGIGAVTTARAWREHRRHTALVFQQHHLIGRLHALDNVLTGRLAFHSTWRTLLPFARADKMLALEALARVGLADQALQRADKLSGGQQQRVGIARALAQQPRVLLADEPVASLDPATAVRVLELMHGICKEQGIAAAVSLHQVDLATRFADRIVGISAGRVVFDGVPAALDATALRAIYGTGFAPAAVLPPRAEAAPETAIPPKLALA
jgi:phosphonate transport system ATP-binding protein